MTISVSHLKKYYQVHKKEPGFMGSIKSLVSRKYESVKAVDDISFDIAAGELVGFIGPNGAGKTTTLKCLSGLLWPTQGSVSVLGYTPFERKTAFLKQIALVMGQKNQLWWDLPAAETFLLNKEIYEIADDEYKKTRNELVDLLEVEHLLKIQVRKLSLGERMKMELIAALIHSPKVLFLDEPTIGLDVVMQKKMRDFIQEYNELKKSTILLTSHYMEDVRQLARRVIIIDHGKILYDGKLDQLVKKFAKHKVLSVVLETYVPPDKLKEVGELVEYNFPRAVIRVPRNASNVAAAQLLQKFPVDDLNIEEPDIEDIIRDVFTLSSKH
ncbi:ABC transporter [Candidatus Gottesmanbacteria bacterium RIFCSPLOWO2_01_FULL_48_11]|uniref:ABC transporter related protein n=3 Tax=Candidatus Gottesmaniibacteriota TaxID=1752720 RepID=A0A0G1X1J8_9BACT|nr:MAG: ABC transporter related protein [Candidatus Gottesmanbacteria bacterium GW2011_GWA2_47_9]OGG28446.1 MAG: ABC transporter [Candidatus Gottesmanbacteria bacterium RIFCSPLOWO2_01_FULL_48_11]